MLIKDPSGNKDYRWQIGFAIFLTLLTAAPYLVAFGQGDPDWVFTGFLFGVEDGNSYIAKMLSGANGAWTFKTPYTTYPQAGVFMVYLQYILLGKLASPPEIHLQLVLLFQTFRIIAVFMIVFAAHDFIAYFEPRINFRRFGTVLVTTGGGLGWVIVFFGGGEWLGSLPLDFYSPETFGFLAIFGLPHLAAGRALLLWGLLGFLKNTEQPLEWEKKGLWIGLLLLGSGFFSPINPAIAWLVMAIYLVILRLVRWEGRWLEAVKTALLAGIISSPVVGYSLIASLIDPFFDLLLAQIIILSPHPLHYLLAYALYLPWVFIGGKRLYRRGAGSGWFPLIWVGLIPVLAYLPLNLQRRLPEAAFTAIVILVIRGMGRDDGEETAHVKTILPVAPAFLSAIVLIAGSLLVAIVPSTPVFRPAPEVRAMNFLGDVAEPGAVVLSTKDLGNAVPAFIPLRVVIGHGPETIGYGTVLERVEAYFDGSLDEDQQIAMLEEYEVDYVFGPSANTPAPPGGERIYFEEEFVIFKVK